MNKHFLNLNPGLKSGNKKRAYIFLAAAVFVFAALLATLAKLQSSAPQYTESGVMPRNADGGLMQVKLMAMSMEKDLFITVCDADGNLIKGYDFCFSVDSSNGENFKTEAGKSGAAHLTGLFPGEYTIDLMESEKYSGFIQPGQISCIVKNNMEYVEIENLESFVDTVDISEVPSGEIKQAEIPAETPPYDVSSTFSTPDEALGVGKTLEREVPKRDANGNQLYSYSYKLGPNGYILFKGSDKESDLIPVDEDNDGQLDYALRLVAESGAEDYEQVALFNADNSPVAEYEITATALMDYEYIPVGWQREGEELYYYDSAGNLVTGMNKIDGMYYFLAPDGAKANAVGIDVSSYSGNIDWAEVKAQGFDFAIIRLGGRTWGDGAVFDDPFFQQNLEGAKAAGVKVGVYFYSTAVNEWEAVQEASVTLNRLNGAELDLPIFIDVEYSDNYPNARHDVMSADQRTAVVKAFCSTVIESGYSAGVYASVSFFKSALHYYELTDYTIWIANYTHNFAMPYFDERFEIWQGSATGWINGINAYIDINILF